MDLPLLIAGVITLLTTLYAVFFRNRGRHAHDPPLPPGSSGWPLIGETLQFASAGRKGKPESFVFERLSKHAPLRVFRTSLIGNDVAVVCGAAANKFLFHNENKLVTLWFPPSFQKLFPLTGDVPLVEEAKRTRRHIYNLLSKPECLRRHVPVIDDCTRRHIGSGAWGPADRLESALHTAKDYTFWVACRVFMNLDAQRDPETVAGLFRSFDKLTSGIGALPVDLPGTTFNAAIKASVEIRRKIVDIVKARKAELAAQGADLPPSSDILSNVLVNATNDDGIVSVNDADLAIQILGHLVAGHDTTSTVIVFLLKFLGQLPHVYDKVYQEQMEIAKSKAPGELLTWEDLQKMKYSWNVACEVMRLVPPSQGGFKQAITDFVYDGFRIPKGWKVYWSMHSTHRDPECFPEPEKFDPSRFEGSGPPPYSFVPFGGGPRMCPGREYARIKILVFLHNIVTSFKWESLLPDEKIIVTTAPFPANGLPLRMISH